MQKQVQRIIKKYRELSATTLEGAMQELWKARGVGYKIEITEKDPGDPHGLRFRVGDLVIEQIPYGLGNRDEAKNALYAKHSNGDGYIGYRVKFIHDDKPLEIVEYKINSKNIEELKSFGFVDRLVEILYNIGKKPKDQSKHEFNESFKDKSSGFILTVLGYLDEHFDYLSKYKDNNGFEIGGVRFDTETVERNGNIESQKVISINDWTFQQAGYPLTKISNELFELADKLFGKVEQHEEEKTYREESKKRSKVGLAIVTIAIVCYGAGCFVMALEHSESVQGLKDEELQKAINSYLDAKKAQEKAKADSYIPVYGAD